MVPDSNTKYIVSETSLVDLFLKALNTCGTNEDVVRVAAINPMISMRHDTMAASLYFLFLCLPGGILVTLTYTVLLYFKAQKNLLRFYA